MGGGGILNAIFIINMRLRADESGVLNNILDQLGLVIIHGKILNNFFIKELRLGVVESGVFNKSLDQLG